MDLTRQFKSPWWVVFGAMLGLAVGNTAITLFTFGLFLKPVTTEFGWNRATFATAILVSQVAGAISMPAIGKLLDRWGIRWVTLSFIVVFCVATALLAETRSAVPFILLYGISGVAGSGRGPIAYAKAISAWFEGHRGLALGVATTGVGIGTALVPQVTRILIDHVGWRGAYIGLGAIVFAVSFPTVALFIREPAYRATDKPSLPATQDSTVAPLIHKKVAAEATLLGSGRFWLLMIAAFLASASLNGIFTHIVPLLTDRGVSVAFATSILSVSAVALVGGQLISGYLLDRFFAAYVASFFFLVSVLGIFLLTARALRGAPMLGGLCLAFGIGTENNLAAFLVSRHFGMRRFSEIFGYVLAVSVLGNGSGPWLMAHCYDAEGSYRLALGAFGVALIAATLFICRLGPYRYPPATTNLS